MSEKKKYSELVLEERKKGNVVFIAIDEVMSAPVKDFVAQPVDGLLWDLNRDEVTALTFMDQEGMIHWVNNFAVALVIKELKSQLTQLETENGVLKRAHLKQLLDTDYCYVCNRDGYDHDHDDKSVCPVSVLLKEKRV